MRIKFGAKLNIQGNYKALRDTAQKCEALGFYSALLYDHFFRIQSEKDYFLECWTTLSALAAETKRIRLGPLVTCVSYRNPALLAKMAATLDVISKGRLEFGIGAGWKEEEYISYGYRFPKTRIRVQQLREAVEIIRRMWTEEKPSYEGQYYRIKEAICDPKPIQKPHPPILIGGAGEKYVLRAVAERADICNFPGSTLEYERKLEVLRNICSDLGKNYGQIEKSWTGDILIIRTGEKAKVKIEKFRLRGLTEEEYLKKHIVGTMEECIFKLQKYADLGVTYFTLSTRTLGEEIEMFADEVIKNRAITLP